MNGMKNDQEDRQHTQQESLNLLCRTISYIVTSAGLLKYEQCDALNGHLDGTAPAPKQKNRVREVQRQSSKFHATQFVTR